MDEFRNVAVIMNVDRDLLPFFYSEQGTRHAAVVSNCLDYLL